MAIQSYRYMENNRQLVYFYNLVSLSLLRTINISLGKALNPIIGLLSILQT